MTELELQLPIFFGVYLVGISFGYAMYEFHDGWLAKKRLSLFDAKISCASMPKFLKSLFMVIEFALHLTLLIVSPSMYLLLLYFQTSNVLVVWAFLLK